MLGRAGNQALRPDFLPLLERLEEALEEYRSQLRGERMGEIVSYQELHERGTGHIGAAESCAPLLQRLTGALTILDRSLEIGGYFENPAGFIDAAAARHNRIDRVNRALSQTAALKKQVKISGVGIHSGAPVNLVVKPSKERGIFFKRVDMPGTDLIAAMYDNVGETKMRNTTVGQMDGAHVQTIEHLMAALFMVGIDSAIIEIDGPETPILDGSAAQFIDAFRAAGVGKGKMKRIVEWSKLMSNAHNRRFLYD